MATALDTIAHVVLPNMMKLKGVGVLLGAIERRDGSVFNQVWQVTGSAYAPSMVAKERDTWRIGVMSLPAPKEMGEAHMCAFVAHKTDQAIARYFTLEHDFVLATGVNRTLICEREGQRTVKLGEGPKITGDFATDGAAFADAIFDALAPKITKK